MITRKRIWRLIIGLMTYLNRYGGHKIDFCSDSSHYPGLGIRVASVKRLIRSMISQNKALGTATSATCNIAHRRVNGQTLCIVGVCMACQSAVYRLPE